MSLVTRIHPSVQYANLGYTLSGGTVTTMNTMGNPGRDGHDQRPPANKQHSGGQRNECLNLRTTLKRHEVARTVRQSSAVNGSANSLSGISGLVSAIATRRDGSRYGSGFNKTAFTTLNIAAFAPIPKEGVISASVATLGFLRSERTEKRKSPCSLVLRRNWPT
jgi:hypothetical protein